ncbi:hypothetical protein GE21DRAFT_6605 [Neurospora crassa]|uniref:Uncharacterized protein n=1 Tax=Neurospora crassa (strain ATCC 24698 / 74-OR23-1A / CBS 708.71 / DSM 1257 / FGSC 987) TaxID=367110 RepID=Q7S8L4_NEUCR|nr:hypothetical protein NCU05320 [Neurospora crassa OR74A]EAA32697.1 hypothetical protein NCU05320 [Neurospora crassa OR74A]KHE84919.1 hypothetical protein GE21DRAFT_6605 [Neurospora crassa]|eukprot:XP_961933.1 hypothetical protein NCU05320 [Neurospora crassa OR74A]
MDPALHTKLKTAFHKFRKWGLENHNHLVSIADDLENSEVHKPKNYKAYQMLFWRFRGMWPNVCLVQQILKDQAPATCRTSRDRPPTRASTAKTSSSYIQPSQPSPQNPAPPTSTSAPPQPPPRATNFSTQNTTTTTTTTTSTTATTALLFSRFKSPVMLPFAKWWAESQDKREGPLLPAPSFEGAIEGICSCISLIVDDWEAEILPLLVSDVVQVDRQREPTGGAGA